VLLDWPRVVLATEHGTLDWDENANQDGRARASFRYVKIKDIPPWCVIASSVGSAVARVSYMEQAAADPDLRAFVDAEIGRAEVEVSALRVENAHLLRVLDALTRKASKATPAGPLTV
jgi:hypothetical protein